MVDYGRIPFSRWTAGVGTLQRAPLRAPLYTPAILGMARLSACLEEASLPGSHSSENTKGFVHWLVGEPFGGK